MDLRGIDKTTLNIVALSFATGGALTVLTKANVPRTNVMFFGANMFAVKRDAIESSMAWLFTALALVGVLVQLASAVLALPERIHQTATYVWVTLVSGIVVTVLMFGLTALGTRLARPRWRPQAIDSYRDFFALTEMLAKNDGLEDRMLDGLVEPARREQMRVEGRERLLRNLLQLEELFEFPRSVSDSAQTRLTRIRPLFLPPTAH